MGDFHFGPDRFSRFDVYWIQTNKQTEKQNIYIDVLKPKNDLISQRQFFQ